MRERETTFVKCKSRKTEDKLKNYKRLSVGEVVAFVCPECDLGLFAHGTTTSSTTRKLECNMRKEMHVNTVETVCR